MLDQFAKNRSVNHNNYAYRNRIKAAVRDLRCNCTEFMIQKPYSSALSDQLPSILYDLNKPSIGVETKLSKNRKLFPTIDGSSILKQDKPNIEVRLHSGRTDSNRGHHDYKNVSGLGPYHYHNGLPPHTYEDNVINNISSVLNGLIQSIKAEFDYYIDQVTDSKRRDSLIIGLVASIAQNILKSGLSIAEAIAVVTDIATNFLSTENSSEIIAFFDDAEAWLSQPIDNLANRVSYKDSYYLGKSLGDIMSMLIGLFGVASGIATFIGSFGLGVGSVAAAPGTAGASLVGIAVSVEGALAGTAVASGSIALAGTAFSSFGKDFAGFTQSKNVVKSLGDKIRGVENDILDKMESAGGHTLEKHVSQTNEELIRRAIQEEVDAATSFTDKSTAIKAVQENLRKNADDIAGWLLDPTAKGYRTFNVSHSYPVGKGVLEDTKHIIYDLTNSSMYIVKDATQEFGFKIITAYPTIK